MINNFVMGINAGGKRWISKDAIYMTIKQGGLGLICLEDFSKAMLVD